MLMILQYKIIYDVTNIPIKTMFTKVSIFTMTNQYQLSNRDFHSKIDVKNQNGEIQGRTIAKSSKLDETMAKKNKLLSLRG